MAKTEHSTILETIKRPETGDTNPALNFWREVLDIQMVDESERLLSPEEILRQQEFRAKFTQLITGYVETAQSTTQELSQLKEIQNDFQRNELTFQQLNQVGEITRAWNNSTEFTKLDEAIGSCRLALNPTENNDIAESDLQEKVQQLSLLDATSEERATFYSKQLAQVKKKNPLGTLLRKISDQIPQVRQKRAAEQQGRITALHTQLNEIHQKLAQKVVQLAQEFLIRSQNELRTEWVGLDLQALSHRVAIDSAAMDQLTMSIKNRITSVVPPELIVGELAASLSGCADQWRAQLNTEIGQAIAAKEMRLTTAENQTTAALRSLVADTQFLSSESFAMIQESRNILPSGFGQELVTTAAQKTRHRCNLSQPEQLLQTVNAKIDALRVIKEKPGQEKDAPSIPTDEEAARIALANEIDASKNMIMAELFSSQTRAWLQGYKKVWEHFFSAKTATEPIAFDTTQAQLIFAQQGSEIGFGSFNVIDCLKRTAESHNRILAFMTEWRAQKAPGSDEGAELFSALVSLHDRNIHIQPHGSVKVDMTPPVTSVRLVFSDVRDYKLAVKELSVKDCLPEDAPIPNNSSGGMSFLNERSFVFEGIGEIKLPFTAHLEKPDADWMEQVRIHEDAHQAMGYRPYNETDIVKSGERRTNNTHLDTLLRRALLAEEKNGGIGTLRAELRNSIHEALSLRARDEVQAYLSDGTELPEIFEILSDSELYDYVAPTQYRVAEIQAIEAKQNLSPEEKRVAIARFKAEAIFARKMYVKSLERFIRNVQRLRLALEEEFTDPTDAHQALLLIEKNMLPEEQAFMARFLAINSENSSAIQVKRQAFFKGESASLSQQATEAIHSREVQLQKYDNFVQTHRRAAETIIAIAREFAGHIPSYYTERFPQLNTLISVLNQNDTTEITAESLLAAQDFFVNIVSISQELTWTANEEKQKNDYLSWKKNYGESGADNECRAAQIELNVFLEDN